MMAKSKRGSGFAGVINYAYEGELEDRKAEDKKAEIVLHSDNIRVPRDAEDLAGRKRMISDFIRQAQTKETPLKENVGHHVISFNTKDSEKLTEKLIKEITQDYINERGLSNTQFVAIRHHDTDHEHLHIIFNRVDNDGKTLDSNNYFENSLIGYDLSMKYNLHQPPKQKKYIENIQKKDPNFRENLKQKVSTKVRENSQSNEIRKLRDSDELFKKARNLHHLTKLCESENKKISIDGGFVFINEKKYKQSDVEAVFLLNRQEAKSMSKTNSTETANSTKKQPDYVIKKDKIAQKDSDSEFIKNMLNYYLKQNPVWDSKLGKVSFSTLQKKMSENNILLKLSQNQDNQQVLSFEYNGRIFTEKNVGFKAEYIGKLLKNIDYKTRLHIAGVSVELQHIASNSQNYQEYKDNLLNISKFEINEKTNTVKDNVGYEWNVQELFKYSENLNDVYEANKTVTETQSLGGNSAVENIEGIGQMAGQKASGSVKKLDGKEEDEEELKKKRRAKKYRL